MDEEAVINQVRTYLDRYYASRVQHPKHIFHFTASHIVIACKSTGLADEGSYNEIGMHVESWMKNGLKSGLDVPTEWHIAAIDDKMVYLWTLDATKQNTTLILRPKLIATHHGDINTNLDWLFDNIIRHRHIRGLR